MSTNTALAISLHVLGAIATWLFLGPSAARLRSGPRSSLGDASSTTAARIRPAIGDSRNRAGAIVAGITLSSPAGVGASLRRRVWAAICVGIGVAAMVLLANVPLFATIPAQVYGFASVVAMTLLRRRPAA